MEHIISIIHVIFHIFTVLRINIPMICTIDDTCDAFKFLLV